MRTVRVGDVLHLQRRRVVPEIDKLYSLVGVYSFGKGIFHRDPTLGIELGNYKFYGIRAGDLVLSNIQAWEGAIAFAAERDHNTIGTHRFLSYTAIDADVIDTKWAHYYFLSPAGFPAIQKAAPGSVTRNRTLSQERFEDLEITLPNIDQQRDTARYLDQVKASHGLVKQQLLKRLPLSVHTPELIESALSHDSQARVPIRALCQRISNLFTPGDPYEAAQMFVGLEHIEKHTGRRLSSAPLGGERGGKKRFEAGDVIYGSLRPYLNKAWVADRAGLCSVDQQVLRPNDDVDPQLLSVVIRTRPSLDTVLDLTSNQMLPRIRVTQLDNLMVRDPRSITPCEADKLRRISDYIDEFQRLNTRQIALSKALFPAALASAFSDMT